MAEMQDASQPYSINMTVNGDPRTQMGFAWFTNPEVKSGKVQIEANAKRSYTSHKALATTLKAGTTYSFRVGTEQGWSEIGHFTTASDSYSAEKGYSFIYMTDTQAQNDEMFDVSQKTAHAAQQLVPEAQFVLVNGDLVETSGATTRSGNMSSGSARCRTSG